MPPSDSSRIRVTKDALDKQAEEIADIMAEDVEEITPYDPSHVTGHVNMRGQPTAYPESLYPVGRPIVSRLRKEAKGPNVTKRKSRYMGQDKPEGYPDKALKYFTRPARAPFPTGWYVEMIKRGDNDWEVFTGWNEEEQERIKELRDLESRVDRSYEKTYGEKWVKPYRPRAVKDSKQIVLEHLDSRPIICESEEQATLEARRLGKEINATDRLNEGKF